MPDNDRDDALEYHSGGRPGKTEVVPTKPTATQRDLALAYTPGVAKPCLEIAREPGDVYKYTNKGNLVAVISNGTAVLGLGNIGAAAGKPVMEGKAVLFKRFADIYVFDLELPTPRVVRRIQRVLGRYPGLLKATEPLPDERVVDRRFTDVVFEDDP